LFPHAQWMICNCITNAVVMLKCMIGRIAHEIPVLVLKYSCAFIAAIARPVDAFPILGGFQQFYGVSNVSCQIVLKLHPVQDAVTVSVFKAVFTEKKIGLLVLIDKNMTINGSEITLKQGSVQIRKGSAGRIADGQSQPQPIQLLTEGTVD